MGITLDNLDFEDLKRKLYQKIGTKEYWSENLEDIIYELVGKYNLGLPEHGFIEIFVDAGVIEKIDQEDEWGEERTSYRAPNFRM